MRSRWSPLVGMRVEDPPEMSQVWSQGGSPWRSSSEASHAEQFDLTSNASADSWWRNESWSWGSWDGSSGENRANWVYVSQGGSRRNWSDPWHRWHADASKDSRRVQPDKVKVMRFEETEVVKSFLNLQIPMVTIMAEMDYHLAGF